MGLSTRQNFSATARSAGRRVQGKPAPGSVEKPVRRGALAENAVSVLMLILYAARSARFDTAADLAQRFGSWDEECGTAIYRLMCCVHCTLDWRQMGYVGDYLANAPFHFMPTSTLWRGRRDAPGDTRGPSPPPP